MNIFVTGVVLALSLCRQAFAASGNEWRGRSIYQVFTDRFARTDGSTSYVCDTGSALYCGGTWSGLINRLDYIQNMGFDAIWISPVTEQIEGNSVDGTAYHGYWQTNINEVNSHFGTKDDLRNLAQEVHARGMFLMVDIVVNHFAWIGSPDSVDYTTFTPFNSVDYFHPHCNNNYDPVENLTNVEQCWMGSNNVPLPDVRTEDSAVADLWNSWIKGLVADYSIDGLRIDSVMEVNTGFWAGFQEAAGVYSIGEVYLADADTVCSYQDYLPGVFNYATYFPLIEAFRSTSGNLGDLANMINTVKAGACKDTSLLGSFSENHDQPRFGSLTPDMALAKNVITYTMLADGIPTIYQGQELHYQAYGGQTYPYNREAIWSSGFPEDGELYIATKSLNAARKNAARDDSAYLTSQNFPLDQGTGWLAMRKGKMVTVLNNFGADGADGGDYDQTVKAQYNAGEQVTEMLGCTTLTAGSDGSLAVPMSSGQPRVFYPSAGIGSLCSNATRVLARSAKWRHM